jgi:hypothetical protein
VNNWKKLTNSQNRVRKKSFGGTFCFSNCHIIRLDTGGLVFLVSDHALLKKKSFFLSTTSEARARCHSKKTAVRIVVISQYAAYLRRGNRG